ncbi:hypothetical protein BS50DRAFT_584833 [Corynespora cassiicola Philippines]|uniref:Uncharacterized protein n=1 Tax=Corynespora cassiicola Philippines TaxID=1448308 RepID=A0A2T2P0X0_CORCC|nr:hypothetical protein BS50DRAFT_584833 [Corynespora cassiicola Philippines]
MRSLTSPLYILWPPVLLLVSVPLALFAVITTAMAVSLLTVRVSIVYFELGIALVHAYLFPPLQKPAPKQSSPRHSSSPHRARNRRSSMASTTSSQDTAVPQAHPRLHNKSGSFQSLIGTSEITRDFEGVGGWRLPGDEDEEALWMGINSRLELPAVIPKRKHQRSLTGGSQRWSWSPEAIRMSPMQSRARTPVQMAGEERHVDDYFPPQPASSMRPLSSASDQPLKERDGHIRRKSASSSSSGGGSSSRRLSTALKQAGE